MTKQMHQINANDLSQLFNILQNGGRIMIAANSGSKRVVVLFDWSDDEKAKKILLECFQSLVEYHMREIHLIDAANAKNSNEL